MRQLFQWDVEYASFLLSKWLSDGENAVIKQKTFSLKNPIFLDLIR